MTDLATITPEMHAEINRAILILLELRKSLDAIERNPDAFKVLLCNPKAPQGLTLREFVAAGVYSPTYSVLGATITQALIEANAHQTLAMMRATIATLVPQEPNKTGKS